MSSFRQAEAVACEPLSTPVLRMAKSNQLYIIKGNKLLRILSKCLDLPDNNSINLKELLRRLAELLHFCLKNRYVVFQLI